MAQPQWLKRWRKLGESGFRFINGSNGQPRSLEPRQFGGLPGALRAQINNFLSKQAWSQATMQQLARQL